jgi:hypothetical protein
MGSSLDWQMQQSRPIVTPTPVITPTPTLTPCNANTEDSDLLSRFENIPAFNESPPPTPSDLCPSWEDESSSNEKTIDSILDNNNLKTSQNNIYSINKNTFLLSTSNYAYVVDNFST